MRLQMMLVAATAALAGTSAQAASVAVKDAVARVTVIPEDRNDVRVEIVSENARLPLSVRSRADRTIVDGDLDRRIRSCRGEGEGAQVQVEGVGWVSWREMPQVVIRTPRNAEVEAGGAVFGSIGRTASLKLANTGCGDWTLANVQGEMRISQAGSGDTRAGSAGAARLRIAGSGAILTREIRGPLSIDVAGSGDVAVASVEGPLDVDVAGSGDVRIGGGRAAAMTVAVAGSGDVAFDGVAERLKASIAGSGDVRAREVRGEISQSVLGSGSVTVGR